LGHAAAKIMGIEQELGELIFETIPGALSETNENIFCYDAQMIAKGDRAHGIREFAADAIRGYLEDDPDLLASILAYLKSKLN
jgi:hypothetical protein